MYFLWLYCSILKRSDVQSSTLRRTIWNSALHSDVQILFLYFLEWLAKQSKWLSFWCLIIERTTWRQSWVPKLRQKSKKRIVEEIWSWKNDPNFRYYRSLVTLTPIIRPCGISCDVLLLCACYAYSYVNNCKISGPCMHWSHCYFPKTTHMLIFVWKLSRTGRHSGVHDVGRLHRLVWLHIKIN